MKFKFNECVRHLSLDEAVVFVQLNRKIHYHGVILEISPFDEDNSSLFIQIKDKFLIVKSFSELRSVLKSLHYFVHHKWLYKYESVGLVHCLFDCK